MNKKKSWLWIVIGIAAVALVAFLIADAINAAKEVTSSAFIQLLAEKKIDELYIDAYNWTGYTIDENGMRIAAYTATMPSVYDFQSFVTFVSGAGIDITNVSISMSDPNAGSIWSSIFPILGIVLVAVMIFSFYKVDPLAAKLQIPYFLWLLFAAYLNFGVWSLNR